MSGISYVYQLQERERIGVKSEKGGSKGNRKYQRKWHVMTATMKTGEMWKPLQQGFCWCKWTGKMSPLNYTESKKGLPFLMEPNMGADSARSGFIKLTVKLFCYQETMSFEGLGQSLFKIKKKSGKAIDRIRNYEQESRTTQRNTDP